MKRWLAQSISFGSLLLATLVPRMANSCASGPEAEYYRFASFLPFIHYKPVFASFNFCSPLFYDTENKAGIESDRQRNINEWLAYTNNAVSREAIYEVLYETAPSTFERVATGGKGDPALEANPFFQWMMRPEHHAVKEYMRYAKYSEVMSSLMGDPWEEDIVEDIKADAFIQKWEKVYHSEKEAFLRERYAFQFLRLNFYLENYDAAIAEYEKSFAKSVSKSVIKPWAEEYYAMIFRYREDRITANYHLAKSFAACDDKKIAAVMYFTRDSLEATLDLAKNDHDRFTILATSATNDPQRHLQTLKTLYRLEPQNDLLEMLVTREINKCEDWLLSYAVMGGGPAIRPAMPEVTDWTDYDAAYETTVKMAYAQDLPYAKDLTAFVDRIVSEGKASNEAFWLLADAYCHFLTDDVAGAKQLLARHFTFKSQLFSETAEVLDVMLRAKSGAFDAAFETKLMEIDARLLADEKYDERHRLADQLKIYVSYQYGLHGDYIRSTLISTLNSTYGEYEYYGSNPFISPSGRAITDEQINQFVELLRKTHKTPFESYMTKRYAIGTGSYYAMLDDLGTVHLNEYHFKSADTIFSLIPDSIWNATDSWASTYSTYLNQNPFIARFGSNHHTWEADTVTYSKKSFTQRMLHLQSIIADPKSPGRDDAWRQYADAFFNMTFYGNSWLLVRNYWSRSEIESYYVGNVKRHLSQNHLNYYGCRAARTQYAALFNASRDPEIKAHCAMMISRCDRNLAYIKAPNSEEFKYKGDQYLTKFLTQYKKTNTYKKTFDECGDRDAFLYWTKRVIE